MKETWIQRMRGYVRLEVRGQRLEGLLNRLTEKRMAFWDIRYLGDGQAELMLSLPDFFRLRPLLKETGCRTRVRGRFGLPFWLGRLEKRKFFVIGLVGFFLGIYVLSSVVWQVRVEGNEKLATTDILQAAKQTGIYKLQWKQRLKDAGELSRALQSRLPGTAWIGVELHGTQVLIKVVEARTVEPSPLMNPRHLVAAKSALVTQIFAEKGRPAVKPNTYVRPGDILISGILGDELNRQTVVAQGTVKGIVWYKPTVEVPLTQQFKAYTGETRKRSYLVLGRRALQLSGYGAVTYEQYESVPERKTLQWKQYALPIGWISEKVLETRTEERAVDPKEAKALGLNQARSDIAAAAGRDAKVVSEKILHEKTENGKVYMEVLFEVEESIAIEQPIVP